MFVNYKLYQKTAFSTRILYIYRSTFPLFKNRFSDNLRLFKRQIVPIRIHDRFDFSADSLFIYVYTVGVAISQLSHTATTCWHNASWDALVYFFPPAFPSYVRSLISVIEHRTLEAGVVHMRGTRVVRLSVIHRPFHPLFFAPPPCSSPFSAPMYANPVYELAKCTRKCIRRTINCRSGRGTMGAS